MKATVREKVVEKAVVLEIPWEEAEKSLQPMTSQHPWISEMILAVREAVAGDRHIWLRFQKPGWWDQMGFSAPGMLSRCLRCELEVNRASEHEVTSLCPGRKP